MSSGLQMTGPRPRDKSVARPDLFDGALVENGGFILDVHAATGKHADADKCNQAKTYQKCKQCHELNCCPVHPPCPQLTGYFAGSIDIDIIAKW